MTVNLRKGETISLAKNGGGGLSAVRMGLGWDPVKKSGSFLGKMFGGGGGGDSIDLDASVLVFDGNRRVLDAVWFRQLRGMNGAITHSGDNLTGDGDGDDETISVDLARLSSEATWLVFTVNSFRGQTFDEVDNAFCRLVDDRSQKEICRHTLAEKGRHTGVVMAKLHRDLSGSWSMTAIGAPAAGRTVEDMASEIASRHL